MERVITTITRRAWLVWAVAVLAYLIGVMQRTSLSTAGLQAAERYEVTAAVLSTLAVVQLMVYAALQLPVGILVDRVGARALIATGALLMASGQLLLGLSHSIGWALVARMLVGAGDAMTWLSAVRLVAAWMPPRRAPLMTQLTAQVGRLGQILSIIPLAAILAGPGWTAAYLSAAALGIMSAALTLLVVRDFPVGRRPVRPDSHVNLGHEIRQAWRNPGTRLGFWTHSITSFSPMMILLLWGYPFLISGEGLTREQAALLFTVMTVVSMGMAPLLGELVARHPLRRSWLVLGSVALLVATWTAVLVQPGPAPAWMLWALIVALAIGGPTSVIGFDYARTFNEPRRLGTASGMVNVGGFSAALVTTFAVGLLLNLTGAGETYSLEGFRVAFSFQYVVWAVGLAMFLRTRRQARALLEIQGTAVPSIIDAVRRSRGERTADNL